MSELIYVVIPAKDEASRIGQVLEGLQAQGLDRMVVVDDGSGDHTGQVAQQYGAEVVRHLVNLGAGAATKTGIEYALSRGADIIVTIDGDGQHYPEDAPVLLKALQEKAVDVVIGSRFLKKKDQLYIPRHRRLLNYLGNALTAIITGVFVSDSQSGYKAFRASFARQLDFQFKGYEFCTEFIHLMRHHGATFEEVPIRVRYSAETMAKGQSWRNGFHMLLRFIRKFG